MAAKRILRILSFEEADEKLRKGLCLVCDEPSTAEHKHNYVLQWDEEECENLPLSLTSTTSTESETKTPKFDSHIETQQASIPIQEFKTQNPNDPNIPLKTNSSTVPNPSKDENPTPCDSDTTIIGLQKPPSCTDSASILVNPWVFDDDDTMKVRTYTPPPSTVASCYLFGDDDISVQVKRTGPFDPGKRQQPPSQYKACHTTGTKVISAKTALVEEKTDEVSLKAEEKSSEEKVVESQNPTPAAASETKEETEATVESAAAAPEVDTKKEVVEEAVTVTVTEEEETKKEEAKTEHVEESKENADPVVEVQEPESQAAAEDVVKEEKVAEPEPETEAKDNVVNTEATATGEKNEVKVDEKEGSDEKKEEEVINNEGEAEKSKEEVKEASTENKTE